jgi:hypothetical protein
LTTGWVFSEKTTETTEEDNVKDVKTGIAFREDD